MLHEEAFFRARVPASLQKAILRTVMDGCAAAYDQARARDHEFFADAVPTLRRLAVEPMLSRLVLPRGFASEIVPTPSTNCTKIFSGEVTITAVTRSRRVKRVAPYRFRKTLAKSNQTVFDHMGIDTGDADESEEIYALLIYGGVHKSRIPTIARFVFPLPDGTLLPCRIDLLTEYSDIVDSYRNNAMPAAATQLKIRKKKKEG